MKAGLAGLDTSGQRALCGIAGEIRGKSAFGIAGVDGSSQKQAACGVAGINTAPIREATHRAAFGMAGVKDASVLRAAYHGVAGNLGSSVRDELPELLKPPAYTKRQRLGDQAAQVGYQHGVYFADYAYVICTDDNGRGEMLRWRKGREEVFGRSSRALPLFFDCAAYRRWTGTAPKWVSFDTFLRAIDLADPDGYAAYDVIGDQAQSLMYFDTMLKMGYGPDNGCFPVYHVRPTWDDSATVTGLPFRHVPEAARCVIANARRAAQDPVLRHYASKSILIGLGGMVRGPIPRDWRHYYIWELCNQFPDHQFWALGQANFKVVNGLGAMGLLDRVWTDGTWWILDAACERFAVVMDGQIRMHSLEGIARSFFTITECMAANLRSLLSAYAGLWEWPPPDPLPLNQHDPVEAEELGKRFEQAKFELFGGDDIRVCGSVPVRVQEEV